MILALAAAATALLAVLPGPAALLIAAAMLAGAARGVFTLLQATAISDRWGAVHYGRLNGLLSAPALLATALAPWAGAALAQPSAATPPSSPFWPDWLRLPRSSPPARPLRTSPDRDPDTASTVPRRATSCQVPAVSPASPCFIGAPPWTSTLRLVLAARRVPRSQP